MSKKRSVSNLRRSKSRSAKPGAQTRGRGKATKSPTDAFVDVHAVTRSARRRGALGPTFATERDRRRGGDLDPGLLPTRDAILDALKRAGVPLPPSELAREMAVDKRARDAFFGRIEAMQRDGQLLMNRKGELCVIAKLDLIAGTVQGHPDGFGFLVPDDGSADLFLRPSEMHKVLHGDRATGRRTGFDRRGRPEGEIVDVLARAGGRTPLETSSTYTPG